MSPRRRQTHIVDNPIMPGLPDWAAGHFGTKVDTESPELNRWVDLFCAFNFVFLHYDGLVVIHQMQVDPKILFGGPVEPTEKVSDIVSITDQINAFEIKLGATVLDRLEQGC
jgi:hypothetical protein